MLFNNNKKASAFNLVYGLFFLLVLGVLFVVFNQINQDNIRPVLDIEDLNFSQESKDYGDKFLGGWALMPFIIVFVVALYIILWVGVRGGQDGFF